MLYRFKNRVITCVVNLQENQECQRIWQLSGKCQGSVVEKSCQGNS